MQEDNGARKASPKTRTLGPGHQPAQPENARKTLIAEHAGGMLRYSDRYLATAQTVPRYRTREHPHSHLAINVRLKARQFFPMWSFAPHTRPARKVIAHRCCPFAQLLSPCLGRRPCWYASQKRVPSRNCLASWPLCGSSFSADTPGCWGPRRHLPAWNCEGRSQPVRITLAIDSQHALSERSGTIGKALRPLASLSSVQALDVL